MELWRGVINNIINLFRFAGNFPSCNLINGGLCQNVCFLSSKAHGLFGLISD